MRVVHIIIGLNIGGAETMLKNLIISHLPGRQYEHIVISLTDIGILGRQLQANGVDVYTMKMRYVIAAPLVLFSLAWKLRKLRPDIVQTWLYHADLIGGLAARLVGVNALIWGIHTVNLAGSGSWFTAVVRKVCAYMSRWLPSTIVCVAEASKRAHAALGYCTNRMVVIPNGFDLAQLSASDKDVAAIRAECGLEIGDFIVGCLGRFNRDKDQKNFVNAVALISQGFPAIRFLMVGRNCDRNNSELMGWIEATGVKDCFILLGERSDAPACLAAMDIYCLSSRSEAFPLVVGEAMAMGRPCVITDVGDVAILVADTCIVVPKENSEALAHGIRQLLEMKPVERHNMGRRARARIESEFTIDRTRSKFETLYRDVLSSPRNWCIKE